MTQGSVAAPAAAASAGATAVAPTEKFSGLACHGVDHRGVDPRFRELAKRYGERPDGVVYPKGKIHCSGSGLWGSIPRPPRPLGDTDADTIAHWLTDGVMK